MNQMNIDYENRLSQEGSVREELAAYFLSVPPLSQQSEEQKVRTRQELRRLAEVEADAVLQFGGFARPLSEGNVTGLLTSLLEAARTVATPPVILLLFPFPLNWRRHFMLPLNRGCYKWQWWD